MKTLLTGLVLVGTTLAGISYGQDEDGTSNAAVLKQLQEITKQLERLTERVKSMEQRMQQMEDASSPSFWRYNAVPNIRHHRTKTDELKRTKPKGYLRFPIEVEEGMMPVPHRDTFRKIYPR